MQVYLSLTQPVYPSESVFIVCKINEGFLGSEMKGDNRWWGTKKSLWCEFLGLMNVHVIICLSSSYRYTLRGLVRKVWKGNL